MKPRIIAAISNVNMGKGHEALFLIAKRLGVNLGTLPEKSLVIFINRARDKMKILESSGVVLGYIRMPNGEKLPLGAIQYLPQAFSANGRVDVDGAVKLFIQAKLKVRGKPGVEEELGT